MPDAPRMTGAGMMEFNEKLYVTGINPKMTISIYDQQLQLLEKKKIPSISPEIILYWATRIVPVGDYFLMLTMGRDPGRGWLFDTGDLYVTVLDGDLTPLAWQRLTAYDPKKGGGMRPWMEVHENQVLIVYEKGKRIQLIELVLNLQAFEQ